MCRGSMVTTEPQDEEAGRFTSNDMEGLEGKVAVHTPHIAPVTGQWTQVME